MSKEEEIMMEKVDFSHLWHGVKPPQYIFANKRFKCVVLDPPNLEPGSWIGAGKVIFDHKRQEFLLTARPRKAEGKVRGFAACIYRSKDGEKFEIATELSKEEIFEKSGLPIHSIEGTQLLRSSLTGDWHFYLSVDTGSEFVWGGIYWETLLLISSHIEGPWKVEGLVLKNDRSYDAAQARDATIDIIDGKWFCLYKAVAKDRQERPALATSSDGISWEKRGTLSIDGTERLRFLSGSMFAGENSPLFMGVEREPEDSRLINNNVVYADEHKVGHGARTVTFAAYIVDYRNLNLETIFRSRWQPQSEYEHTEYPLLGYASLVYDPLRNRMLMYIEAIDRTLTKNPGINETVERLLLYETAL